MRIENLNVAKRLGIGFGTLLVCLLMVAGFGMHGLRAADQALHHIADVNIVKIELLSDMSESSHVVARVMRTIALLHDDAEIAKQSEKITAERAIYDKSFGTLEKMPLDEAGKAFVEKIKINAAAAREINNKFMALSKTNPEASVKLLVTESIPINAAWQDAIHEFSDLQKSKNRKDEDAAAQAYQSTITFISLFTLAALIASIALAVVIARSIIKQLGGEPNYTASIANGIAEGDLTLDIATKPGDRSSLLYAIKLMRDSLEKIVLQVRTGTEAITAASSEISTGNMDLSSRTEHQASALEETAASMEELTSTVKNNADNANRASQLAVEASSHAEDGGRVVEKVVETMTSINESSKKIVDIIGVINGIAFQTNILALNAAVEAARAGEQGRGFAVVASEVRNLAQRSAAAAKEIKELIGDSVEKVEAGTDLVDKAGETMKDLVASVRRVSLIIGEIAAASTEQTAGIEQINEAITQMDEVTQQNAALVEQAAAASQSMQDQASVLTRVVSLFKLHTQNLVNSSAAMAGKAAANSPLKSSIKASNKPAKLAASSDKKLIAAKPPATKQAEQSAPDAWDEF